MRIAIGGTTYDGKDLDRLTLGEILRLEDETRAFGRAMTWSKLRAMADAAEELDDEAFLESDDAPWLIGLTVWVARLRAGEAISFADAINFPIGDLQLVDEDLAPTTGPRQARPGKRPADRARPAGGAKRKSAAKTSAPPSSDG